MCRSIHIYIYIYVYIYILYIYIYIYVCVCMHMVGGITHPPSDLRIWVRFLVVHILADFFSPGLPEIGSGTAGEKIHQVWSESPLVTPSYLGRVDF